MKTESKKYKNKEWLKSKYVDEELSLNEIADICNVSHKTISNWKIRFDMGNKTYKKIIKECSNCGENVERRPSMFEGENVFCSTKCESIFKTDKKNVECAFCGDEIRKVNSQINNNNFCSIDCRTSFYSGKQHGMSNSRYIQCYHCKDDFKRPESHINKDKNFCSKECYHEYIKTNDNRNSNKAKKWRNDIRNRDNWTCQDCGEKKENIEAHHIKKWKDNPDKRFEMDNGVSLCLECHYLRHKNNNDAVETRLMKGRVNMKRVKKIDSKR